VVSVVCGEQLITRVQSGHSIKPD